MFRSSTIIRELTLNLAKVIFMLKHSVKLRRYLLCGCVAACCLFQPKYKLALSHPMLSCLILPYCKPRRHLLVCILFQGWPQSAWHPSLLCFAPFAYEIIFRYFTNARAADRERRFV